MTVQIRKAKPTDADALSELVCAVLWASNLADYGAENIARVAGHFSPDGVRVMLADGRQTWVATLDDTLVGMAGVATTDDPNCASVKTFFVDARVQRQGVGSRLFDAVRLGAEQLGCTQLTVRSSLYAVPFYSSHGFAKVRDHWDGNEHTVEMRN